MIRIITAAAILCALASPTQARQRHHATGLDPACNVTMPCEVPHASTPREVREMRGRYIARELGFGGPVRPVNRTAYKRRRVHATAYSAPITVASSVVTHPAGCPSRAFCGCGAAVRVFGSPIRNLWLAANWFKFPRTQPAPGTVAVRSHHVFVLEQHLSGDNWLAYDANSGGHATRIHARSIAGYVIVDPRG